MFTSKSPRHEPSTYARAQARRCRSALVRVIGPLAHLSSVPCSCTEIPCPASGNSLFTRLGKIASKHCQSRINLSLRAAVRPIFADFPAEFPDSREFGWRSVRSALRRQPSNKLLILQLNLTLCEVIFRPTLRGFWHLVRESLGVRDFLLQVFACFAREYLSAALPWLTLPALDQLG